MRKRQLDPVPVIGHELKHCAKARSKNQSSVSSDICLTTRANRNLGVVGQTVLNPGTIVLNSVTDYLYREAQECRTAEERDGFTLALAICAAVRRGDTSPFTTATYAAFGTTLNRYLKYRSQRQWEQHQALLRCIPDYDPEVAHALALPNRTALMAVRTAEPPLDELAGLSDVERLPALSQSAVPELRLRTGNLDLRHRMGGVLIHANVEQTSEVRGQQARPRNLYEMPSKTKPAKPQPVRVLPRAGSAE